MKLTIFGASGATGRLLVAQALDAGHDVTVLLRSADSLPLTHVRLICVVGSLDDEAVVQSVVQWADVVLSALGARKGGAQTICTDGMRAILLAMQAAGVQRLVALSAYGASDTRAASWFIRFVRMVIKDKMQDKDRMEDLVRASATDWTLVRPAMLTNGKATGAYRSGMALRPAVTGHLSRADLAAFMLDAAIYGAHMHAAPVVST